MQNPRLGLWLIGARGGIGATTLVGLAALKRKLVQPIGLVSTLPNFAHLLLPDWNDFVVGGHEIRKVRLADEARRLVTESRAIDPELLLRCIDDLDAMDCEIRPGTVINVGQTIDELAGDHISRDKSPAAAISRLQDDLVSFREHHQLEHVIVVNVASTEPPVDCSDWPNRWEGMESLLANMPASSLYAIAALDLGFSYINFTPSLGSFPAAIQDLALQRKTRHMGCDGKTGETLLKSVLAPMFRHRNLEVMSWVGHNIFGNMDGRVLDNPVNKQNKLTSKMRLLDEILGYQPQSHVSIEYIQSMGDWKTAWDHIHFQGFLGTRMVMQFIWQGCDSLLAAPLVLDLARFTEVSHRRGETGLMPFLASFFKSPYQTSEHCFDRQFALLEAWAAT